ncbi:MAG: adenosylmethionine--8-amino-7-oxononanoate transaminase [Candidatus Dormibacteria bacterium]
MIPGLVAVAGTDTGAGKTLATAAMARALRGHGVAVGALKPVATGVAAGKSGDDAEILAAAVGQRADECALETFVAARSPLAAASAEGRRLDVDRLAQAIGDRRRAGGSAVLLVEMVGGLMVPLSPTMTVRDLIRRLDAPVVIAARSGLGTINHCALTVEACRHAGLRVLGIVLSDVDGSAGAELATENADQVARQCAVPVIGVIPYLGAIAGRTSRPADGHGPLATAAASIDAESLTRALVGDESTARLVAADRAHVWHPFTQATEWVGEDPPVIASGEGCRLRDEEGNTYLDGISSLWANVHGHAHPRLDRAAHEQLGRIAHTTFLGLTHAPGVLLAEELCAVAPAGLTRVFYSESGAAAVEVGLRIALLAQRYRGESRRTRFLSLQDAYHGDTAGAVSVGRSEPFHRFLEPLLFDSVPIPSPFVAGEAESLAALSRCLEDQGPTIAALIIEPRVQAAAGIWPHSDGWLRSVVERVRAAGALIICDEVATGFGRTGALFASSGAGVGPDLLCLGKGLTGGYLPLSATLATEELYDLFTAPYTEHRTLYHGHTYSGNPTACAVARASLQLFEQEGTVQRGIALAGRLGKRLPDVISQPMVRGVRQCGVMVGIDIAQEYGTPFDPGLRMGRPVVLAARQRGVIVRSLGDVVVLNPPLVMTDAEADVLISGVAAAIASLSIH